MMCACGSVLLLYAVILAERLKSAEKKTVREDGQVLLGVFLLASFLWFLAVPFVGRFDIARDAFPLAGLLSIILSSFFLILSIEFYDSASGWRGGEERKGAILRLHLASIASHSALFGVPFALLGACLLLCFVEFWLGCVSTYLALLVVTVKTEMERSLWRPSED